MQHSRRTASPAAVRAVPAPLSMDTSHSTIHTPARPPMSSDMEHLSSSPINFSSRQSAGVGRETGGEGDAFLFNQSNIRTQQLLVSDHMSISFTDSDPLLPGTSDMLAPEQASFLGTHLSREERWRVLRHNATGAFLPGLATFMSEKLMVATDKTRDVYSMVLSHYQQQQYERALEILHKYHVLEKSIPCRYIAALCAIALGNGLNALCYLGTAASPQADIVYDELSQGHLNLESAMCFARGKAYLLEKDVYKARDWFKEALTADAKCYDALAALVKYNMMEEKAEWEFVMTLPYEEHCGADSHYYQSLYRLKLKRGILERDRIDADPNSVDVQLSIAQAHFSCSRYKACLQVCQDIKAQNPGFTDSISLYVSSLYKLDLKNKLYEYAQELVKEMKDEAVSWHAVGLYHLCIHKHSEAKLYFSHALVLNCFFEPAWLGYACTLSLENDHNKAIEAYIDCSRLVPGSHLPYMHVAMEYIKLDRMALAFTYFELSLHKCNHDPCLLNEMAVYYYKQGMYKEARQHLHTALSLANERQCKTSPIWEKIWCNLGHVYRHPPLQDDDRAIRCSENALDHNPKNTDARTTLGMIYQLKGNTARAIAEYHQVLVYANAPELVNELLQSAIMDNVRTSYASKPADQPCLHDSFDVFEMANSVGVKQDQVAIELEQDGRYAMCDCTEENPSVLLTEDDMLVDQGDLQLRESGEKE